MVGRTLANDRYELIELIGEGGAARVYRARDHLLGRDVAVKILRSELAGDPQFSERFRREATAAAGLSHPNIAQVFDIGVEDGAYYYVMELVPGGTLRALLDQRGVLPTEKALELAEEVASALAHAHDSGIIHRDIKPLNILLTRDGHAKVVDFGIARALAQTRISQAGMIVGSVHYVSPEQARGEPATPQSDVYALGVVLYEMLTGHVPYDGETPVSIALQHAQAEVPDPRAANPSIPDGAADIAMHAMAKGSEERYSSARALLGDLHAALKGTALPPAPIRPETRPYEATRVIQRPTVPVPPPRRTPERYPLEEPVAPDGLSTLTWTLIGLTLVVLAAGIGVLVWLNWGPPAKTPSAGGTAPSSVTVASVPYVISMNLQEAKRALRSAGIDDRYHDIRYRDTEDYQPDTVIAQDPGGQADWHEGERVVLTVARGQPKPEKTVTVPDVTRKPKDTAVDILTALGLVPDVVTQDTDRDVPEGTVLQQAPRAGDQVDPGATVTIWVAKKAVETPQPAGPVEPSATDGKTPPPTDGKTGTDVEPKTVPEDVTPKTDTTPPAKTPDVTPEPGPKPPPLKSSGGAGRSKRPGDL